MPLFDLIWRPQQLVFAGAGHGGGFSAQTLSYVPGSAVRGAVAAAWWRSRPPAEDRQREFDALMQRVRFSDARPVGQEVLALDRATCKYPGPECPPWHRAWDDRKCAGCKRDPEPAKGGPSGEWTRGHTVAVTRVALGPDEVAREDFLYERQGMDVRQDGLVSLVRAEMHDLELLSLAPGLRIRLGGSGSVAGQTLLENVVPLTDQDVTWDPHELLRIELMTAGVFVDRWGFPSHVPDSVTLADALGMPGRDLRVERAFTRWTTAGGWHRMAGVAKPADDAVVAHSVFHVSHTSGPDRVPAVICDLGVRQLEGCGWARVSIVQEGAHA